MIRLVPNGICTTYVHRHLKVGDLVRMNGPYGDFFLRETDREIICIAGGSGMAPIKSILADMRAHGVARRTRYFFGAVTKRDLYEFDSMAGFEKDLADFRFIPALSAPLPDDDWHGETGLITEVVARHLESGDNVEAYLCGSPGMINACIKVLETKGVPRELIYFDSFG
jgi:Na+-transporting NADH:ubiquinone oxidoreductase subunit F